MSQLRHNLFANYVGQAWAATMGLAFIPLYIRYLGIEAYGLIGVYAALQAWLSLVDIGMTPTLSREMARFTAGAHTAQTIQDLLRTVEEICWSVTVLVALGIWSASDYLANSWFHSAHLSAGAVAQAVAVMSLVVALRFVEGIYRGALVGLQRQIWYNAALVFLSTARYAGAAAIVVCVASTLEAFFLWQAVISLITVAVLAAKVHVTLPKPVRRPAFSKEAVSSIRTFAAGMLGITALGLLLTQVDKLVLSRLLPLESFGYYSLATTLAGALYLVISPLDTSIYPRLVELVTRRDALALASLYHRATQLLVVLTAPAALVLSFFPEGVIYLWTGDVALAHNVSPMMFALGIGTFLNGLLHMPYQLQIAHGWTSLSIKTNMVAVCFLVPGLLWCVPHWGAVGAAWIWLFLNCGYALIAVQLMHRRLLSAEKRQWYVADVLLPFVGAFVAMLAATLLRPFTYDSRFSWFCFLVVAMSVATIMAICLANHMRSRLLEAVRRGVSWVYS